MPYAFPGLGTSNLAGPVPRFHSAVTRPTFTDIIPPLFALVCDANHIGLHSSLRLGLGMHCAACMNTLWPLRNPNSHPADRHRLLMAPTCELGHGREKALSAIIFSE